MGAVSRPQRRVKGIPAPPRLPALPQRRRPLPPVPVGRLGRARPPLPLYRAGGGLQVRVARGAEYQGEGVVARTSYYTKF